MSALQSRVTRLEAQSDEDGSRFFSVAGGKGATDSEVREFLRQQGHVVAERDWVHHDADELPGGPLMLVAIDLSRLTLEQCLDLLD